MMGFLSKLLGFFRPAPIKPVSKIPPCERCGGIKFFPIPDSLALACKKCGFVWVNTGPGEYKKGASVQEWLERAYGKK